jgi:hypothetical protein
VLPLKDIIMREKYDTSKRASERASEAGSEAAAMMPKEGSG